MGVRRDGWMNSAGFQITVPIQELQGGGFTERTLQNVKDSDGTVVVYPENFAAALSRPFASVLSCSSRTQLIDASKISR